MSKITGIEIQKRNKNRVNLYVDNEYLLSLQAELVYKYNLSKNQEIDEEKLLEIARADDYEKAKNKALNSLSKVEKSEKKIREKLSADFDEEVIEEVVEFLKKHELVDDERFAEMIVSNDLNFKRVGKNRIKQNLYTKGIKREYIESAISDIDSDVELENAIYLAKKRLPRIKDKDINKVKNKLYQHLSYKGFSYDIIKSAIREVLEEDSY
ncbi:MAG: Regulatory protein RecX [Peptostreptococcus russellii]|uniref:Regulatory protein RecX n=1 Tax=Peptostreptococcus russellii TaxID=215200 RepID=A0A2P7Q0A5_9FIRM|nr:recombination regulator RecX [Peptostreptococcus russellii]PSJ31399.1 recombinase RecX [Peptostreptococcus russellii]